MIVAERHNDIIQLQADPRQRDMVKAIPGARWQHRTGMWHLPLAWSTCLALRGTFGDDLQVGPLLLIWATAEKVRVDTALGLRSSTSEKPYGFQDIGVAFLRSAGSALLADDMGLGKTRQAIMAAELPCLVVCPKSVMHNWKEEWSRWRPDVSVAVCSGTASKKRQAIESGAGVVIVNWESLRSLSRLAPYGSTALSDKEKTPGPLNREWATVIADEAHRAKDPKSKQTRALWAVGSTAQRRIALTGTPVANSPADLWSVMHFVSSEEWPSRTKFIDRYCQSGFNWFGGLEIHGLRKDREAELFGFLDPRFLRRTKQEVLPQLPAKTYQARWVEMKPKQAKAYKQLKEEMITLLDSGVLLADNTLTLAMRLLQASSAYLELDEEGNVVALTDPSCKLDAALDISEEAGDQPLVFFTVSRKLADLVSQKLDCFTVSGTVEPAERQRRVEAFQNGDINRLVLTAGAGAEGLTLTAASTAVFLQRPWSLVQSKQAEDRIHRIGQTRGVTIIDVVTQGTLEERVHEALTEKEEDLQQIVRDPEAVRRWLK